MIIIAAAVIGIALGAATAGRRGGKLPDLLQYGAGYGIAFSLLGVVVTIIVQRNMMG